MNALPAKMRQLYKGMSLREKLLSLCFLLVLLFIWSNHWFGRLSDWNTQRTFTREALATQQVWLDRSEFIAQGLATALERVDPSKTYAAAKLFGRVEQLVRQTGLTNQASINSVRADRPNEGEIFNDHNLRLSLKSISMAQLISLNNLLKQETPYINIQSVRIEKNNRNPEQLEVRYEINSFDLKDTTLQ